MGQAFIDLAAGQAVVWGLAFFGAIYLVFCGVTWALTHHLLPAMGMGKVLDPRPLAPGQLRRELSLSALSILIFGVGMLFPWGLLQLGWARLATDAGGLRIGAAPYTHWFAASRRHHLHHACYHGNYGFQFGFMDRLFGTRLAADAAQPAVERYMARQVLARDAGTGNPSI